MTLWRKILLICIASVLVFALSGCEAENTNVLKVLAGSELGDLSPMLDKIQKNTGVRLEFTFIGTLDGAEQIMAGSNYDLGWFSHAKYLNLIPGSKSKVLAQEKIMLSPVVLGVKQSKAQAWGWINNSNLTWNDIVQKAASGDLKFAMTNPASSNTGFSALVGVAAALSGKGDALTKEDIKRVSGTLQNFFKGQALTAGSSGWLADQYITSQDSLNGLINYESVLLGLNKNNKLNEDLYLVYPKEGIITADYPLLLLNPGKREDYNRLVTYLKSADFQREIMSATLRRPVNTQVSLSSDFPNQLLVELPFPNSQEVVNALLLSYLNEQIKPSHTFYILDTSGSMEGERIKNLMTALENLTGADQSLTGQFSVFRNREKVTFLTFNTTVTARNDFEVDSSKPEILQRINQYIRSLKAGGNTAIYTALMEAYKLANQARQQDPDRLYSIVLMSDGENNAGISEREFQSFFSSTTGLSGIRTFTILFGDANAKDMQKIASTTNGRMFDASKTPLATIFKEIRGYQ